MDRQKKIRKLSQTLAGCRKEINELERETVPLGMEECEKSLGSSVYYLNKANRQIMDLSPMKGQLSLFDI